jgi:GTPase SAR1 family protein
MQFDIWDTAGQERFRALGTLFCFKYLGKFFMIWVFFWFLIVFGPFGF